ncbi:MAG: hypothetical protein LBK06_08125 [Planctomycetaceae bacterium]|nr:hypothetical protein [Planctomycetaceae bacterium]
MNTVAQQREAVTRGRSLLPYRLRYNSASDISVNRETNDKKKKKKISQWCPNNEWLNFAQN